MCIGCHECANNANDDDDNVPKPAQSLSTPVPRQKPTNKSLLDMGHGFYCDTRLVVSHISPLKEKITDVDATASCSSMSNVDQQVVENASPNASHSTSVSASIQHQSDSSFSLTSKNQPSNFSFPKRNFGTNQPALSFSHEWFQGFLGCITMKQQILPSALTV